MNTNINKWNIYFKIIMLHFWEENVSVSLRVLSSYKFLLTINLLWVQD